MTSRRKCDHTAQRKVFAVFMMSVMVATIAAAFY